jgi:hypothetical protein
MRVFVYWNLHKGLWSVKSLERSYPSYGKVVARLPIVLLTGAEGKVSEAGRQRVLRERKKNVHAGIVGRWSGQDLRYVSGGFDIHKAVEEIGDRITYNPYKYDSFVHAVDESPFEGSAYALLTADRAVYVA